MIEPALTRPTRGRRLLPALLFAAPLIPQACSQPAVLEELAPEADCRQVVRVGPVAADPDSAAEPRAVRWLLPEQTDQLHRLNAWCAAVGPAVVGGWAEPGPTAVDSVAVVTWNVHVGGGALRPLVEDLRSGRLTGGGPVDHFVLLLQEAYRGGPDIPPFDPALPGGSGIYAAPPGGAREDIVRDAEALGLDLYYAPSMRNGEDEDRGNAILSTLPLHDLMAIPLPVARQRRVALAAVLSDTTSAGVPWRLQVASVHLESDAAGFTRDEAARMLQTEALLDALPEADAAVAGGDFNTRVRGPDSEVVDAMMEAYPDTPPFPVGPTYRRAWGLYRLYLDYLFFRLPDPADARYLRVPDPYNSDHYPLVGWVILARSDGVAS